MGRLDKYSHFLRIWFVPLVFALAAVGGLHITLVAGAEPTPDELLTYLQTNSLQVGAETVDKNQQIYYLFNDEKIFVTNNVANHTQPVANGQFIAWVEEVNGAGQIFLYNIISKTTLTIVNYGTNQNPALDASSGLVWEQWVNETWQIMYFDGLGNKQLSINVPSVRPTISGNQVAFAQQLPNNEWQVVQYDVTTDQASIVPTISQENSWPHFDQGVLKTDFIDALVLY